MRPRGPASRRVAVAATALGLALVLAPAAVRAANVINVEIDYMQDVLHSHQPSPSEIAAVVQMFATHGITLNAVVDQAIPEVTVMMDGPDPKDFFTATGPNTYSSIKSAYFQHFGQAGWHYCVFGHQYSLDGDPTTLFSTGLALRPGYDLVVTLGRGPTSVGTPWGRAATFAHELGHNLGLNHGGSKDPNDIGSGSAVYPSVMSYAYQLTGVRTHMMCLGLTGAFNLFKDLDYSNGRMPDVNEGALDEALGLGMTPVDWNCDNAIGGVVSHDLNTENRPNNTWCGASGLANQDLGDWNDWATVLGMLASPQRMDAPPQLEVCPPMDMELRTSASSDCIVTQPAPSIEPAVVGEMEFVNPAYGGSETGTGNQPFRTFLAAYGASPPGSVIYLRPGSYITGTGVLGKPLVLTGPGAVTLAP